MSNLNNDEFNRLIGEKKFDEAKAMLREFFETELNESDEGEYYVTIMAEYLEMSNRINAAYISEMKSIKSRMAELDEIEGEIGKSVDTDQIRKDIESL